MSIPNTVRNSSAEKFSCCIFATEPRLNSCTFLRKIFTVGFFLFSPASVFSANVQWVGTAGDWQWNTASNWSSGFVPTADDDIIVDVAGTVRTSTSAPLAFRSLTLGGAKTPILKISTGVVASAHLNIKANATLEQNSSVQLVFSSVTINSGGILTHSANASTPIYALKLRVDSDLVLQSGAKINVDGKGYPGNAGPGHGQSNSGGGYGGYGCDISAAYVGGAGYGSTVDPSDWGSGGGSSGPGGGLISLSIGGNFVLNGGISANGTNVSGGAGSGGTINIRATAVTGSGTMVSAGGRGACGGSGGRIAVRASTTTFSGTITAYGGNGAGAGTVYKNGELIVNNNSQTGITAITGDNATFTNVLLAANATLRVSSYTTILNQLTIGNAMTVLMGSTLTVSGLTINSGGTLSHPILTPSYLMVTGDMVIQSGGKLLADGMGYPKTAGPGAKVNAEVGASYGGIGSSVSSTILSPMSYGSVREPVDFGSGGGGTGTGQSAGGAGGGAVKITANSLIINGALTSDGMGSVYGSGGSGGSIHVIVQNLSGNGTIHANGGGTYAGGNGGGGRIAIYGSTTAFTGTVKAYGGGVDAGAGTIYENGDLIVNNNGMTGVTSLNDIGVYNNTIIGNGVTLHISSPTVFSNQLSINNLGTVLFSTPLVSKDIVINSGGILTCATTVVADITATGTLQIASGGKLLADGMGYPKTAGPGAKVNAEVGASYGGIGSSVSSTILSPMSYGSVREPVDFGSGGGGTGTGQSAGGAGGGAVKITANSLIINGALTSDGMGSVYGSGGSGGSIYVIAQNLSGSGTIHANGGGTYAGGNGGGGRIAIYGSTTAFTGTIKAYGGGVDAGAGTIYENGDLIVNNNGMAGVTSLNTTDSYSNATIGNGVALNISSAATFSNNFNVNNLGTVLLAAPLNSKDIAINSGGVLICTTPAAANITATGNMVIYSGGVLSYNAMTQAEIIVNGDMNVRSGGKVLADGKGYPRTTGPGATTTIGVGGSYGGLGSGAVLAKSYGSAIVPVDFGSGGGGTGTGNNAGGAGGGLVRITANNLIVNGSITSDGLFSYYGGGGSGGSIHITAQNLSGSGAIHANGGNTYTGGAGGGGRIAIYATTSAFTGSITTYSGGPDAGAGTINTNGNLLIANNSAPSLTPLYLETSGITNVFISTNATVAVSTPVSVPGLLKLSGYSSLILDTRLSANDIYISSGSFITHTQIVNQFKLNVLNNLMIDTGGFISADKKGYAAAKGPGKGNNAAVPNSGAGGAGYGGKGGAMGNISGGQPYGSFISPSDLGSGGGNASGALYSTGGTGGGLLNISVGGLLTLNGRITANGGPGGGGGSGGTIVLLAGTLSGAGTITANGGSGEWSTYPSGGGAGGRIVIYHNSKSFNGIIAASGGDSALAEQNGTIVENGELLTALPLAPTQSVSKSTQTIGYQTNISVNLRASSLSFSGVTSTGSANGTFNFQNLNLVQVADGPFGGKGFFLAAWNAVLDGVTYSGSLKGMVFDSNGRLYIKGTVGQDINGSIEAELSGSTQLSGMINFTRLGSKIYNGKLYLSGTAVYAEQTNYPNITMRLIQSNVAGQMTGYYSGPYNSMVNLLAIASPENPYYGKGFAFATYISTNNDTAEGWGYVDALDAGHAYPIEGILTAPLYSLFKGVLIVSPARYVMTTEKLDNSALSLRVSVTCPRAISPGQIVSCSIGVKNEGDANITGTSLIAVFPPHMDFISASGIHFTYRFAEWKNMRKMYRPFLRWDLGSIPSQSTAKESFQGKLRIGEVSNNEVLAPEVYVVNTQWAGAIFPTFEQVDYEEPDYE